MNINIEKIDRTIINISFFVSILFFIFLIILIKTKISGKIEIWINLNCEIKFLKLSEILDPRVSPIPKG